MSVAFSVAVVLILIWLFYYATSWQSCQNTHGVLVKAALIGYECVAGR